MLIKSLSRVAMATALIFAFSACGSDSSGGTEFDGTATTGDTEDMADDAASLATDASQSLNFGNPSIGLSVQASLAQFISKHPMASRPLGGRAFTGQIAMPGLTAVRGAGLQAVAAVGCTISGHGSDGTDPFEPYDGNGNSIPDDWAVKYVCVATDSSDTSNVVTEKVTIEMAFKENTASLHGFDGSLSYVIRYADEEDNAEGGEFSATEKLDIRATSAEHHYAFSGREYSTTDGTTEEGSAGQSWNASFDPDGTIALGDPLPDGILAFTGKDWYAAPGDVALSFTLDTPTSLLYSAACAAVDDNPPFTQGVIRGRLNGHTGSASFTVTMTDCGVYTVATEHTDDPAASAHP